MERYSKIKFGRKYALVRALLNGCIDEHEVMSAYNIFPRHVGLPASIAAFVYRSRKDRFHIIINCHLSLDVQREVFLHELCHIIEDMPHEGYTVGIDGYRKPIERKADLFVKEVAAVYGNKL